MSTVADAIRCPRCGTLQPPTLDFCDADYQGGTCLKYLGWSRTQPAGPPPPPLPGPPARPTASRVQVSAEFEGFDPGPDGSLVASVVPGQPVGINVTLRNIGTIVDEFSVTVQGLPAGWVDPPVASVHLVPVGHEGHAALAVSFVVRPPRDSSALAGSYPVTIETRSVSRKRVLHRAPATLIVLGFYAVLATARPQIVRGRTKARFWCEVRNNGNTPITPTLLPKDTTDTCTFATPSGLTAIEPGHAVSLPVQVRAPRKLIGQPVDHQLLITVAVNGVDPPVPPLTVIFRQKPLIPWWVPVALALLLALAIALYSVWPRKVDMPSVRGMSSVFVAKRKLQEAGLKSKPEVFTRVRSNVKSGTVLDQTPVAFTRVDEDVPVILRVAVPATYTIIPDLVGMTLGEAEEDLVRRYLKLGTVVPSGAPPSRKIASQIPLPGRARGRDVTKVDVVLAPPGKVAVPSIVCKTLGQAEKILTVKGFKLGTPAPGVTSSQQATSQVPNAKVKRPVGTTVTPMGFKQDPPSCEPKGKGKGKGGKASKSATGSTAKPGVISASGRATASAGDPVAFDDGSNVLMASSTTPLSAGQQPAWSPDGKLLAVREDDGIRISPPGAPRTRPSTVRVARWTVSAPAFAPGRDADPLLAFLATRKRASSRLCFARVTGGALEPSCLTLPKLAARSISWSPGGRVILVVGARPGQAERPGVMRLRLRDHSPANARSWIVNRLLWRVRRGERTGSVFDIAYDPASARLAVATSLAPRGAGGAPRVALMTIAAWPNLRGAQWLRQPSCQVAWDPAGDRLALVESASRDGCPARRKAGLLRSVAVDTARAPQTLAASARNPAWRP